MGQWLEQTACHHAFFLALSCALLLPHCLCFGVMRCLLPAGFFFVFFFFFFPIACFSLPCLAFILFGSSLSSSSSSPLPAIFLSLFHGICQTAQSFCSLPLYLRSLIFFFFTSISCPFTSFPSSSPPATFFFVYRAGRWQKQLRATQS